MRSFTAALCLALPTSAQNVEAPERFAEARAKIAAEVEKGQVPSIAIGVFETGKIAWAEGFGMADTENERAASADTIYRLASISKPFTATAIMQFVERQLVDLDAPVNRYLDVGLRAYRGTADQITVRRLLNHSGGLPTHWNFFYGDEQPPSRAESIRAFGFAAYEPGSRYNYSNFAFGVLDHVVARLGKTTYRDWLVSELLDPLGMHHTDVGIRPGQEEHAAAGYRREGDQWIRVIDYGFDHDGASAVRSSVNDLMRFARLQLDEGTVDGTRLLDQESVLAMRERKGVGPHGIGWSTGRIRGETALSHSGGMPGVSTHLVLFSEHGVAITILNNGGNRGATSRALGALLDVLFGPEGPLMGMDSFAAAAPKMQPGSYRGQLVHPDGPIPVLFETGGGVPDRVTLGGRRLTVESRVTSTGVNLTTEHEVSVGHGDGVSGKLNFELKSTEKGLSGIAYATVGSTCRLPFWVELAQAESKPANTLRVVSYNVLVGFKDSEVGRFLPGAQREQQIAAWLAAMAPDVVALQEMNGFDAVRLAKAAAAWGHPHVAMLKENGYPVALTSTKPITVIDRHLDGLHHGMLHARSHDTDFVVVHLLPQPDVPRKVGECEHALACYRKALAAGKQVIVLGDFNSISPADVDRFSPAARTRYEKWRYRIEYDKPAEIAMTPLLGAGAVDVLLTGGTLPELLPLPRIDFVLASPGLAAGCSAARWLCDPIRLRLSDHPPVVADFAIGTNPK